MFNLTAIPLLYRIGAIVVGVVALYGYAHHAGVTAERDRWEAKLAKADNTAVLEYLGKQQAIDTATAVSTQAADTRIAQANATAQSLRGQLNAIRNRKPLPITAGCPAHVLDDERVQWANRALGYTAADGAL